MIIDGEDAILTKFERDRGRILSSISLVLSDRSR